ncbi:MAG: hypothetical protein ACE37F_14805 [Nannocystaceae bacterium]|nr:hypothetical protein [bacterium]
MQVLADVETLDHTHDDLSWLRAPWKRTWTHRIAGGRFVIDVHDQPGRWMDEAELAGLQDELDSIGQRSLDESLSYGVFSRTRSAFRNRVIAVARDGQTGTPCGFTAMVYLPLHRVGGRTELIIHLGLTMIARDHRGSRLQTPLFQRTFRSPIVNQFRMSFIVTNIAASPAGIGAVSDYFDGFPSYDGSTRSRPLHREVAQQVLERDRHEFGCSRAAVFDPKTFVVKGSNQVDGGGASAFIKTDPVSRYRNPDCNAFCAATLNFERGDELFQVGRADFLRGMWKSRRTKRRVSKSGASIG